MNTNSIATANTVYDIPTTQHLLKTQPHHTPRAQHANNPVARPDGAPRGRSARSIPPYTTYTAQPSPEETNPALEPAACSIPQAPNPADATGVQACDAQPSPEAARSMRPDVVLMDLNLSGDDLDGIDAAKEIRLATDAKVLLLTSYEKPDVVIQAAKRAFASGYIFKSQCKTLADDV
jgi:CheY-like chemotaxis protein